MGSRGKLTLSNCVLDNKDDEVSQQNKCDLIVNLKTSVNQKVRDTSFHREGADIHVDVGLCITQIGITREAPTKARLGLVMSFHIEMLWEIILYSPSC
ncbi:hypothetical protein Prudu_009142 [Prunus dulcis]|uniref:Uncharacterized protein n=1 Tax=Prunus dulcis TaxID=3755 RepID=A0A4Y1R5N4_PRUDU|nr:hypothetical protein Prudu_009142 [Prunus dulcis]